MYAGLGPLGAGIVARQDAPDDAAAVEECSDQASWPLLSGGALRTALPGLPAWLLWRDQVLESVFCVQAMRRPWMSTLSCCTSWVRTSPVFGIQEAVLAWQAPRLSTRTATVQWRPSSSLLRCGVNEYCPQAAPAPQSLLLCVRTTKRCTLSVHSDFGKRARQGRPPYKRALGAPLATRVQHSDRQPACITASETPCLHSQLHHTLAAGACEGCRLNGVPTCFVPEDRSNSSAHTACPGAQRRTAACRLPSPALRRDPGGAAAQAAGRTAPCTRRACAPRARRWPSRSSRPARRRRWRRSSARSRCSSSATTPTSSATWRARLGGLSCMHGPACATPASTACHHELLRARIIGRQPQGPHAAVLCSHLDKEKPGARERAAGEPLMQVTCAWTVGSDGTQLPGHPGGVKAGMSDQAAK